MIQAERRKKQVLIRIGFVHCIEEVGGEDCEALVEIPRLVLELGVFLDVLGEAKLSVGLGKGCEPDERHEKTAEHFHLVYLKTINESINKTVSLRAFMLGNPRRLERNSIVGFSRLLTVINL